MVHVRVVGRWADQRAALFTGGQSNDPSQKRHCHLQEVPSVSAPSKGKRMWRNVGGTFLQPRPGSGPHHFCLHLLAKTSHTATPNCGGSWKMWSNCVPKKKRKTRWRKVNKSLPYCLILELWLSGGNSEIEEKISPLKEFLLKPRIGQGR